MVAAITALERVSTLNRSGRLIRPLQFAAVKEIISQVGEDAVLGALQRLDDEADEVTEPVDFVRDVAHGNEPEDRKRKADVDESDFDLEGLSSKRFRASDLLGTTDLSLEEEDDADQELNWYVQADAGDDAAEEEIEVEVQQVKEEFDSKGKGKGKTKAKGKTRPWQVKSEYSEDRASRWPVKTEELSEIERITRRVDWLNRNVGFGVPIERDEVLPGLESLGFRQAMRVLRRLEENSVDVGDPNEFIRNLVSRSGWIWSKPDVVEDDLKVAKRVAWLNEFGCLSQPIEWAEVADTLDSLRVPHAMVLLRELEMQGAKISNPTEYIKRTAGLAGQDEIKMPFLETDSLMYRQIKELNKSGMLAAPIDADELCSDLARLPEDSALQLLQEVADKGTSVKDPTGYVRFKLKAKLASLGNDLKAPADDSTKILKRIEWLNDYGGLSQDIDYSKVSSALEKVGLKNAMTILQELEDQREVVGNPTNFILTSSRSSRQRPGTTPLARTQPSGPATPPRELPATPLQSLNDFMAFLKKSGLKRPVRLSEVASALDALGAKRASRILKEMKELRLGLDDPVSYIKAAAQRYRPAVKHEEGVSRQPEDVDDVSKLTSRLNWLNQFAGLCKPIAIDEVVGALYCLGVPQSMAILRGLQERASGVPDPTCYIKQAVQRANMASVTGQVKDEDEEPEDDDLAAFEDEDEEAEEQVEDEAEAQNEVEEAEEVDVGEGDEDPEDIEEEEFVPVSKSSKKLSVVAGIAAAKNTAKRTTPKRVVGAVTGYSKLVPTRPNYSRPLVKEEMLETKEEDEEEPKQAAPKSKSSSSSTVFLTPQEKLLQVRDYALKHELYLDEHCLKQMARLPFYRTKDMIDDVLLGGRNRQGVSNPSRYLTLAVQKMSVGLGVEQGLAMELAVSLGVVLNNDGLDELACIPRQDSHAIIRELARNPDGRDDPLGFIKAEVLKCRAAMDARPFPGPK